MIKTLSLMIAVVMTAGITQAKISPVYEAIRVIDEAVEAMADLKDVDSEELLVHSVTIKDAKTVVVQVIDQVCNVEIKRKSLPPGMVGASLISATVKESTCRDTSSEVPMMSFEKISPKLSKAASLGKWITGIEVKSMKSGKAKLALTYAK